MFTPSIGNNSLQFDLGETIVRVGDTLCRIIERVSIQIEEFLTHAKSTNQVPLPIENITQIPSEDILEKLDEIIFRIKRIENQIFPNQAVTPQ